MKQLLNENGIQLWHGDCFEWLEKAAEKGGFKADTILTDMPYAITNHEWDKMPPLERLWKLLESISHDKTNSIMTACQPFMTDLINSNRKNFKYELIWEKTLAANFASANKLPLKRHENIAVFYKKWRVYNPQFTYKEPCFKKESSSIQHCNGNILERKPYANPEGRRYPGTVQKFSNKNNKSVHPTQKPLELFEWLIKSFTNENDLIIDPFVGSGTTLLAALKTGRRAIGIELNEEYATKALQRIKAELVNHTNTPT